MTETPLSGAEAYLWKQLQQFPEYDWLDRDHPPKTELHLWYEKGWETIRTLKSFLFECSSSLGKTAEDLNKKCAWPECNEPAVSIVNQVKKGQGRDDWEWIPDAPRFLCYPHMHETCYGEKYVPPTEEETNRDIALSLAMERMLKERPPAPLKLDCGLTVDYHTIMDYEYLKRLSEISQEEYEKLTRVH